MTIKNNAVTVTSVTDNQRPAVIEVTVTVLFSRQKRAGSALLMVLWLSAALSAIAFTVANTVRSETERTSTAVDSLRAYYLATGAVDRALRYLLWGPTHR